MKLTGVASTLFYERVIKNEKIEDTNTEKDLKGIRIWKKSQHYSTHVTKYSGIDFRCSHKLSKNEVFINIRFIIEVAMFILSKRLLDAKSAAQYLSISRALLYQWVKKDKIKSVRINGRRLFDVKDLDDFVDGLKNEQKI